MALRRYSHGETRGGTLTSRAACLGPELAVNLIHWRDEVGKEVKTVWPKKVNKGQKV